ncbi:exodeoxyribonuclease V subunit gamma [Aestuariirhabdus sp. Z084]|uniref:exodeoxyribonuclease V subunit gamma n=1 Tax=Aestuariirhabdus haliotis TaxID=2918751 RepID=UPI00201B409B|nr:exodeoxyribonuclease V subunit gamma [Aestuariirhabdus haliotis]MCL6415831.1 exodeoxyribonuclease V subunit gamma [Aestuariirhabdus haliotis]MCL6419867.1 exodeoxyribonuclease V subunit gamma [Aestuariirhabdus haliotis]
MLQIHHSNFAELHQALIADLIREQPLRDPLAEELVLVQSPGMAQWLKLGLANHLGIAANIRFPLPSSFIWQLFTRVIPDMPKESAFNKESMGWMLMNLLPQHLSQPEFEPLRGYLEEDQGQRKRYQLAMKVADIFDQYLVYRPQWILAWENNQPGTDSVIEQPWQPILWRALVAYNAQLGGNSAHRANLHQRFIQALKSERSLDLPQRLFIFGVSALAPQYLDVLVQLGQRCDVHIMQLNPCRHYWGDLLDAAHPPWLEQAGGEGTLSNPLLASMGKLGRDYQAQLHAIDPELQVNQGEHFVDVPEDNLLHSIQRDLLDLNNRGELPPATPLPDNSQHKTPLASDDHSLELHSCHSPMREVQVLHDRLLALFDQDTSLQPRDVLVMVPNIDQYSAAIHSVFSAGVGDACRAHEIPFSIADRGVQQENPLLVSFFQLLQLPGSRFEVTSLLDILEVPQIMQRFDLQQHEFDELREWIRASGIRWGLDQQQMQGAGFYPQYQNSWHFGLRRLLLGVARREREGSFADIQPFDGIEGLGAQKLGKLIEFLEQLNRLQQSLNSEATALQWMQRCHLLLNDFYVSDSDAEYSFRVVRRALEQLVRRLDELGFEEPLTPEVFVDHLQGALQDDGNSQRFLAGQVNFCTLMPMRSIPFRIVCLLGMNDGAYPRSLPPMGFDLMALQPRLGDRSRRDDDRYLFLEALLSAREKLYISYVGRNIRDNSERVASVLVSELIEYCQQGFVAQDHKHLSHAESAKQLRARLQYEHSLQPFGLNNYIHTSSPDQSLENQALDHRSYDARWFSVAKKLFDYQRSGIASSLASFCDVPLPAPEGEDGNELAEANEKAFDLAQLSRFFENSARYFFNQRLRVYFDDLHHLEEDHEPFEQDNLLRYQQCSALVERYLKGEPVEPWRQQLQLSGALAHAGFGRLQMKAWEARAASISEAVLSLRQGQEQSQTLELVLPSGRLTGRINHLFLPSRLLLWRAGSLRNADKLRLWLHHLLINACGTPTESYLVAVDKRAHFAAIESSGWAAQQLETLVQLFRQGQQQPLSLPLGAAMAWAESIHREAGEEQAWQKVATAWASNNFTSGDDSDPYWSRLYSGVENLRQSQFTALSETLLIPLLQNLNVEKSL